MCRRTSAPPYQPWWLSQPPQEAPAGLRFPRPLPSSPWTHAPSVSFLARPRLPTPTRIPASETRGPAKNMGFWPSPRADARLSSRLGRPGKQGGIVLKGRSIGRNQQTAAICASGRCGSSCQSLRFRRPPPAHLRRGVSSTKAGVVRDRSLICPRGPGPDCKGSNSRMARSRAALHPEEV